MNKHLLLIFILTFSLSTKSENTVVDVSLPGVENNAENLNLSDQDRHTSQNYVHEWLSNRTLKEECEKLDDPMACYGQGRTEFMGMDSNMVAMIGKAYTAVVGAMGSDIETRPTEEGGEPGTKSDNCRYIAILTEVTGTAMQQMHQQEMQTQMAIPHETNQKALIYNAANSHETRSKTAQIQGTGFAATTGCYALQLTKAAIKPSYLLKLAGSGFLTAFYFHESKQQKNYASEVRSIAEKLPGKGDCNPITDKACYCAQPETAQDPQYCLTSLHNKTIANTSYRVPCVDDQGKADITCTCAGEKNCFDQKYFKEINMPGFSEFMATSAAGQVSSMANGEFTNGTIAKATAGNAARTTRILGEVDKATKENLNNPKLTKNQEAQAKFAEKLGVPKAVARLLASQPITPKVKANIAKLKSSYGNKNLRFSNYKRNKRSRKNNIMHFRTGKNQNSHKRRRATQSSWNKKTKRKTASKSSKIINYQIEQATAEAEINKKPDTVIFEIISRRYQVSAWRRLDLE